jgi:glutamate-5-semialdehyde dehydrogenase
MEALEIMGQRAKKASRIIAKLGATAKNDALITVARELEAHADEIKEANSIDLEAAHKNGMKPALIDRLTLTDARIEGMAEGLRQLASLDDPIGEITSMKTRPNGLMIGYKRVPLGVVGIIYESRPNVTVDAFGLTFKSGNAVILRGGSDSINSNLKLVEIIRESLAKSGLCEDAVLLISDTDRKYVNELMKMNDYVDVIIPRGGAGLIKNVVNNSTVPVIETGTGNCHIYVHEDADFDMACDIIYNAKTQRIGVCNACESLVVHKNIADTFIPMVVDRLKKKNVEVRGDETACAADSRIVPADEEDWEKEYLDYIISLKTVSSLEEAIEHINKYNTGHSEAIITNDYKSSKKFLDEIDAAAVYVNASTRFTDGFEFGFGAEIGISTQKIHARGPMGLEALTTGKYIILGDGQVRK